MNENNENKVIISNLFWRFADKIGSQAVSSIISIIIARILDPEAFTIVAITNTFIAIFSVFTDVGLGDSIIQKKDPDDLDYSSVFYINTVLCLLVYLVIFIAAPYIASLYNDTLICPLIRVLALTIVTSSVKNIQHAYVAKNLMFKKLFFASLTGTILSGVVGIVIALNGYGAWALVFSTLIDVVVDTIFTWFSVGWRPKLMFSFKRVKSLFNFSSKLLVSKFLDQISSKFSQLIIGKFYPGANLAYFNKGDALPQKLTNNVDYSVNSVMFPVLSKKQDDDTELKKMSKKAIRTNMYIMSPLLVGLALLSKPIITIIYTEKWVGAAPYMQIFAVIYLLLPLNTMNLNVIKSVGRSDIFLTQEIIKKIIYMISLLVMIGKPTIMFAYALLVVEIISLFINSYPNKKLINYSLLEQLKDVFDIILMCLIMAIGVYFVGFINAGLILKTIIQVFVGGIIYLVLSIIFKNDIFMFVITKIKSLIFEGKNNG